MFRFNLDQIVWYLLDNKICSAPILSRKYVDNKYEGGNVIEAFQFFGESNISYSTIHAILPEYELFSSKEELINSLQ